MTRFLSSRAESLVEKMDEGDCDPETLVETYRQFESINRLLAGWGHLYRVALRPAFQRGADSVLDVGCGGGDVLRYLAELTHRDGFSVRYSGIDPDPRAIDFARRHHQQSAIEFAQADLYNFKHRSSLVISNHVLHHLDSREIFSFCRASQELATVAVIHNDICRSDLALALFPLVGTWFRGSFILDDGLRSIRRSFTRSELQEVCPPTWQVGTSIPFRLQLKWNA